MPRDIFRDRERAEETVYFRKQDAKLIEKLRQQAKLSEIAKALAEKLRIDNRGLLERIAELGVTLDTAAAFILSPLIEIAWADGTVSQAERDTIIRIAKDRGIVPGSADMNQLLLWLENRPADAIFRLAIEAIKVGISVLSPDEAEQRVRKMIATCEEVAQAATGLQKLLSPRARVSPQERTAMDEIAIYLAHGVTREADSEF
jgi:uncharacterized tellurite resistance protein B-like protein